MRDRARSLRNNMTDAERRLWRCLRHKQLGAKFRRQVPIGRYIADFVSFEAKLVIEVDGGHHAEQVDDDAARTAWFESQGFRVMRFWNNEVLGETDAVVASIYIALGQPPTRPLPRSTSPTLATLVEGGVA